jgi:hypothetical protein
MNDVSSKFSRFARDLVIKKLMHAEPAVSEPVAPEPEPEPVVTADPVDPATRAARNYIKALTMGRLGTPFFADEMTEEELRQRRLQDRMALAPPPRKSWLNPHGDRRPFWRDREN